MRAFALVLRHIPLRQDEPEVGVIKVFREWQLAHVNQVKYDLSVDFVYGTDGAGRSAGLRHLC